MNCGANSLICTLSILLVRKCNGCGWLLETKIVGNDVEKIELDGSLEWLN